MTQDHDARVQVRPGAGRLCRTAAGLLFSPQVADGWDELVAAVEEAEAVGRGIEPVAAVLAARGLDAPPLVFLAIGSRLSVLVFGDLELRSDHPAVPLLTGRGSQTWVEHTVPAGADAVQLAVTPPAPEDDTDLRRGIVPADGFRVTVNVGAAAPRQDLVPPASPGRDTDVASPVAPVEDPMPPDAAPPAAPAAVPPREPERAPPPPGGIAPPAWQPPPRPSDDPEADLRAIQAAAVTDEGHAAPAAPTERMELPGDDAPEAVPADATAASATRGDVPAVDDLDDDLTTADPGGGAVLQPGPERPLVDAVRCRVGHPNPPGQARCRSCEDLLPADGAVEAVPRPALGQLSFEDGGTVVLEEDVVLGRQPPDDGRRRVTVTGDRVSRHHAELVLRGWEVLLHDPGSRNGTYVVSPGSDEPVRVDPEVPVRLEPGARVYLGTRSFVFDLVGKSPAGSDDSGGARA